MLGLENTEEILQILDRYTKLKLKAIPQELEDYLGYVAKTGDPVYNWSAVQYLFREKLTSVIKDFHDTTPSIEELPQCPNVDAFNYENLKTALIERLDMFHAAPFTLQRLCELLTDPKKHYCRLDKYMRALEKNILVVSTIEPGRKQDSENGDSMPADIMLDSDVEKDMTGMSDSNKSFADISAKATASTPVATASSSDSRKETENGTAEEDVDTDLPSDVLIAAPTPNVIDAAEPSLDVVLETKDDAKLIDVEGGSDLQEDSIAESSQDADPHIDVVDDIKEKDPITIEPQTSMEVSDKPEEMSIAEPTLDEIAPEPIKAVETETIEMLQADIKDAAKDAEMEEELLAEPVADVNTVDAAVVIAPVEKISVETDEVTPSSTISPVEKIEFEEENDFIFEPRSSKIPRLDIPEESTPLLTEAPTEVIAPMEEAKEVVTTPVEEPTPTAAPQVAESAEPAVTEDVTPIVEEPVSSPLGPSENISSNESIKITEVADSDKTEFSTITSEPVIQEPDTVTTPEPIKTTENENPTEIDRPLEDSLTATASEVSDAVLTAEPNAIIEEVVDPVIETPAIIRGTITPEVPENTEEMSVEEVETPISVATSESAMDAAPINPPVVNESAAVIAPTIVLVAAAPDIVAAEDEQMEVDDTNSTDPMDL